MTENEQLLELGSMVRERRELREELACIQNKLARFGRFYEQLGWIIKDQSKFDADKLKGYPAIDDIQKLFARRVEIRVRLEEIEGAID